MIRTSKTTIRPHSPSRFLLALLAMGSLVNLLPSASAQAATKEVITGEIDFITVTNPGDHWSGGTIVVGGQTVIIPRNLLLDLPANRMTLAQFIQEAPAGCRLIGQSGVAKSDGPTCNFTGVPGTATIHGNRTSAGNVIAGDIFIQKGTETVGGAVTYINYAEGYFRLNGTPGDDTTGVMVRLNDPTSRHTIQAGKGCTPGAPNCTPDPRFALDADNYTNIFATGFPLCLPSQTPRTFVDRLDLNTNNSTTETLVAAAAGDGTGDLLCPATNRTIPGPVDDSRRFAPIMLGDTLTAEGHFEKINGVRFLSAHTTTVEAALQTKDLPDQPDYLFLDEAEIDMPAFQNERVRMLLIGYVTRAPFNAVLGTGGADVLFWTRHFDPTNQVHEFPLASVAGCDTAAGPGQCGLQGLVLANANVAGQNIFRIRYDVDFVIGAKPDLNPCSQLIAEPRFNLVNACNGNVGVFKNPPPATLIGPLSPIPRELQARTGHKMAHPGLLTLDVNGNQATNGEYVFPFGIGLGGIALIEFQEIDLAKLATPISFSGLPWAMDRRLSPGGCLPSGCEGTPQPLDPFPYEGIDPRTQTTTPPQVGVGGFPIDPYSDSNFTSTTLSNARNRMLSYVSAVTGKFDGDNTVFAWPPANPALIPITPTPQPPDAGNVPPVISSTPPTSATAGVALTYQITATDANGDPLTYSVDAPAPTGLVVNPTTGLLTWTPTVAQAPGQAVIARVTDIGGLFAVQGINLIVNAPPVIVSVPTLTAKANVSYNYQVLALDPNAQTLLYSLVAPAPGGMVINPTSGLVSWLPAVSGTFPVTVQVADPTGLVAQQAYTITVSGANVAPVFTSTAPTSGTVNVAYTYQATATDANSDPLTYGLTTGPTGMTINSTTGFVSGWTPTGAGSFPVTIVVSDGQATTSQSFTVTVAAPPQVAPVITSTPVTTATVAVPYRYQVLATDANGNTITYSLPTGVTGMTINSTTGLISWTPTGAQTGSRSITVRATDSTGRFTSQSFTIVVAANTAPLITSTPSLTARVGVLWSYQLTAIDANSGDVLTYSRNGNQNSVPAGVTVNATTGLVTWTPTATQLGARSFSLRVTDLAGNTNTQTFTVTVSP